MTKLLTHKYKNIFNWFFNTKLKKSNLRLGTLQSICSTRKSYFKTNICPSKFGPICLNDCQNNRKCTFLLLIVLLLRTFAYFRNLHCHLNLFIYFLKYSLFVCFSVVPKLFQAMRTFNSYYFETHTIFYYSGNLLMLSLQCWVILITLTQKTLAESTTYLFFDGHCYDIQLTSVYFILSHEAGSHKPTFFKVPPSF